MSALSTQSRAKVTVKLEPPDEPTAPSSTSKQQQSDDYTESLKSKYAKLKAKKAAAAGAGAASSVPPAAEPSNSAAVNTSPAASSTKPNDARGSAALHKLPLITLTPSSLASSSSSSSSSPPLSHSAAWKQARHPPVVSTAERGVTRKEQARVDPIRVLLAPSPYEQSDTVKRKKRPASALSGSPASGPAAPPNPTVRLLSPKASTPSSSSSSASSSSAPLRIIPRTLLSQSSRPSSSPSAPTVDLSDTSHLSSLSEPSLSFLPPPLPLHSSDTLHVSNVPSTATQSGLLSLFAPFGPVQSLSFPPASTVAWVQFEGPASAAAAMKHSAPLQVEGHPLTLAWAKRGAKAIAVGDDKRRTTYAELERELATVAGGEDGEDEADGFDAILLSLRPAMAQRAGITDATAIKHRRKRGVLGQTLIDLAFGLYPMPDEADQPPEPEREPLSYSDLSLPYT